MTFKFLAFYKQGVNQAVCLDRGYNKQYTSPIQAHVQNSRILRGYIGAIYKEMPFKFGHFTTFQMIFPEGQKVYIN